MITFKEKYTDIGNSLILLHGTFYYTKPYGSNEQGALYQGIDNKLYPKSPDIFSADNYLFYCDTDKMLSFRFDGEKSELISEEAAIFKKIGEVYLAAKSDSFNCLFDKSFHQIEGTALVNKLSIYSDNRCLIYCYWNTEFHSGKVIPSDPRHLRVIECTDLQNNILWMYTADHLGFYETKQSKEVWEIHPVTGENYWTGKYESVTKQNPVLFAHGEKPLVIGDIMLYGTNNLWIIAIDITTGKELYVIKSIEDANYRHPMQAPTEALAKNQPWVGSLRYHKKDDVVFSFMRNTYLEIEYRTGKLLMIDNRATEFTLLHKLNQGRFSESAYWRVDDIIYYISDMDLEGDKKKATSYLTAYNVKTREIIFEYPLGKNWKEKCSFHAFKKFQLVDNRFYILDYHSTLWIFEDDDFYERHSKLPPRAALET